jgi:ATP-dependent RNA helicase DBP3
MGKSSKSKENKGKKGSLEELPTIISQLNNKVNGESSIESPTGSEAILPSKKLSKEEKKLKKKSKKESKTDSKEKPSKRALPAEVSHEASKENEVEEPPKKQRKGNHQPSNVSHDTCEKNGQWMYKEHPEVASLTTDDIQNYYEKHQMTIEGHEGECFRPVLKFNHTGLPANVLSSTKGFDVPTPIQAA